MGNYELVDWYVDKKGFDKFSGDKRDKIIDSSSKDFFDEMKKEPKGGDKFNFDDWKSEIEKNSKLKDKADDWFNEQLKDRVKDINEDRVRVNKKREFENNVSRYNSEEDLDRDIKSEEELLDRIKSEIASSDIKVPEIKEDLLAKANEYDSESDVEDDIKVSQDYIGGLKERFKGAETVEEREEVTTELKREAPRTLSSLKGWQTRGVPEALRYITQ